MNLLQLVERVRECLQEPEEGFWTDKQITGYLNDGDLEIMKDLQLGDVFRDAVTVNGQDCYNMPPFTLELNGIMIGENRQRIPPVDSPDHLKGNSGTPYRYWVPRNGVKFHLDPVPDADGIDIRLIGRFKGDDMVVDTDVPNVPDVLHEALVHWACARAWNVRKDPQQAGDCMALYRSALTNYGGYVHTDGPKRLQRRWRRG